MINEKISGKRKNYEILMRVLMALAVCLTAGLVIFLVFYCLGGKAAVGLYFVPKGGSKHKGVFVFKRLFCPCHFCFGLFCGGKIRKDKNFVPGGSAFCGILYIYNSYNIFAD